jgi:hypothetical protein
MRVLMRGTLLVRFQPVDRQDCLFEMSTCRVGAAALFFATSPSYY